MSMKWYDGIKNTDDVVISSRVRLARNLENFPFPSKLDREGSEKVALSVKEALEINYGEKLYFTEMDKNKQKNVLVEEHLISPDFCSDNGLYKALVTDENSNLCVMINEEDHVRIQGIFAGFDLDSAYELADRADRAIMKSVSFAFDDKYGFLTSCPTNLGTGLRASVMLHLPAISATGYIKPLVNLMTKLGLCVRGLYGEGSDAKGCMYQLSNQVTLGMSEEDTLKKLKSAVEQIVEKERDTRKKLLEHSSGELLDSLWRSYGTLRYAYKMDTKEATKLISNVRLAGSCGIIPECKNVNLIKLMFEIMPAHIAERFPDAIDTSKRDKYRADIIRQELCPDNE